MSLTTLRNKLEDLCSLRSVAFIVAAALVVTGLEVMTDDESISVFEFLFDTIEKAFVITGACGVLVLLARSQREQQERKSLTQELEVARTQGNNWRNTVQSFTNGLSLEIDKQFEKWKLSEAEKEVGLLMIKGLSHKEIANLRGTSKATVRQQARCIYQKSALPGKAAFSAYFFEDLLSPSNSIQQTPTARITIGV